MMLHVRYYSFKQYNKFISYISSIELEAEQMDQVNLINYQFSRIKQSINYTINQHSAFNQSFDRQLNLLVMLYHFNFEAVALHLIYKYKQYQYKITSKSVAYRWFQLHVHEKQNKKKDKFVKQEQVEEFELKERAKMMKEQEEIKHPEKLDTALKLAENLDDQEMQGFIIYKPRFIMDSEFSLEREEFKQEKIQKIMNNQFSYDFGLFEGMAEIHEKPEILKSKSEEATRQDEHSQKQIEDYKQPEQKVEEYCFEVEDYQSD